MPKVAMVRWLCSMLFLASAQSAIAQQPSVIPVGLDAYRQWDRWPYLHIGERAYMRSTYDRAGGNEGADASHFLFQTGEDGNVSLDVEGEGCLYFFRTNHWHGSPWHFLVDGTDNLVQETTTADPLHPNPKSVFVPGAPFPSPLALTWAETKGADLSWVPIGFTRSFQMAYSRTHYGTGYYIYKQYARGAKLSQPISTWSINSAPDQDVLDLLNRAGTDIAPKLTDLDAQARGLKAQHGSIELPKGKAVTIAQVHGAPQMLRALEISAPIGQALTLGHAKLRITWDSQSPNQPSVDSPLALFFGAGTIYNRDKREYLVKSLPVSIRFETNRVYCACYFPMPFFHSMRVELIGPNDADLTNVEWNLRYEALRTEPGEVGYFHATYRDHPNPERGKDLVLLDTRDVEGGGDWAGQLVGTSFIFSHNAVLNTLEGDPRFFFDDSLTPQAQGTGTEEWGGGGDYWGGKTMTLPLAGHATGAQKLATAVDEEDKIESAYRFLLADSMSFGKNAKICLEHGGRDDSNEHYETVTYWYGVNSPALVQTDTLHVGDLESEQSHSYKSPTASAPYSLTSRYEWGVDTLDKKEIYPATTDVGRTMKGVSEFILRLDPKNLGVLLRRKLDYQYPNQRAEIFVADASAPGDTDFKPAGVWYLSGSNTCVYSNPKGELDRAQHIVQTSNRRFRDDEFLLPNTLTEGRTAIRIRVRFTPVDRPLYPGGPTAETAWSEMAYTALCYRMPTPK